MKAKVVTFFTSFTHRLAQITDSDAEMLESLLEVETTGNEKIVLVINSPGGQALAAERIVNVCRAYGGGQFEVVVPHMAKSAATMICFGANTIHMSDTAELGPVDPQVPYWFDKSDENEEPDWISAEEYIRSYDTLIDKASSGKVGRLEPFLQQLTKYDARYIEQLRSIQRLSQEISVRLLKAAMMTGKTDQQIVKAIDVFLSQVRTSSHGRMINRAESERCGLKTQCISLHSPLWKALWELYVRSDWVVSRSNRFRKIIETSRSSVHG